MIGLNYGCEAWLLNDADAAGMAEMRYGAGKGVNGVVAVLTAALCDLAAGLLLAPEGGTSLQLFPLATAWYLLTELGSVAENAGKLGAPVPKFLLRAVQALRRQLDREEDDDT